MPNSFCHGLLMAALVALTNAGCSNSVNPPGTSESATLSSDCNPTAVAAADAALAADSSFTMISEENWNEDAVRQVLQVFAFGGSATPAQIKIWADMSPGAAIVEMLTFEPVNPKLSPPDAFDNLHTIKPSMSCLSALWSQPHKQNKIPTDERANYLLDAWNSPGKIFLQMIAKRGWNPVLSRMGFWATNYHMAVNLDVGVEYRQMIHYYDSIVANLSARLPFETVLTNAALTAAVAMQYGHKDNRFRDGRFFGNDDFAREYFQLFFGILGVSSAYSSDYHETVTIPNMARILTDIRVPYITYSNGNEGYDPVSRISEEFHYPGALEIMNQQINGSNAQIRLETLSSIAISNSESLDNLPVRIIAALADDSLDNTRKSAIRALWAGLPSKDLLSFIRKYAVSTLFHNAGRVKNWTSIERNIIHSNLVTLNNFESYRNYYNTEWRIRDEGFTLFRPTHNVFGHQTGIEAAAAPTAFQNVYERNIREYWYFSRSQDSRANWKKDWSQFIPAGSNAEYSVRNVAEFLWHHLIADDLQSFGTLERYHLYALLGSGKDLGLFISEDDPLHVYTESELALALANPNTGLGKTLTDLANANILLSSTDANLRAQANERIGLGINFILATPFAFAQAGK